MTFRRFASITGAGFLAYEALVVIAAFTWSRVAPDSMVRFFDASTSSACELAVFFGTILGILVSLTGFSAFCIGRLLARFRHT